MAQGYFITGTDTDVGKTWATLTLMQYFKQQGKTVLGMKPIAAGCERHQGKLQNQDALLLQQHGSFLVDYDLINPYAYEAAVSPHIAGSHNPASLEKIQSAYVALAERAETVLVEGAGGWFSPLNAEESNADLAIKLALPVILVVGIRLGCINQARLSALAIQQSGLTCAGWLAMCIDTQMPFVAQNIDSIRHAITMPLLAVVPFSSECNFEQFASCVHANLL